MKKKTNKTSLIFRLIGGAMFLCVFIFNVLLYVQADDNGLSVKSLRAHATGECGWICPVVGCTEPAYTYPGLCPLHNVDRVAIDCPPGDEEEEEGEGPKDYDHSETSTQTVDFNDGCVETITTTECVGLGTYHCYPDQSTSLGPGC